MRAEETPLRPAAPRPAGVVLIVDDDRPIADFVAAVVTEAGYAAQVATRGAQALEMARAQWPVLLITDVMLPFMSGPALIAELRAMAQATGQTAPPVVLMTAASLRHVQEADVQAILRKPFDMEVLEALLERLLSAAPATPDGARLSERTGPHDQPQTRADE